MRSAEAKNAIGGEVFADWQALNRMAEGGEVVDDENDVDDETLSMGHGDTAGEDVDGTEFFDAGADGFAIKADGLAVSEFIADFPDEIHVGVSVRPEQAEAIGEMGAGAERFDGPAGAEKLVDRLGVVNEMGVKNRVEHVIKEGDAQKSASAIGFSFKVGKEAFGLAGQVG